MFWWKEICAMFTGIIRELGVMESLEHTPEGGRMNVRAAKIGNQLKIADSVAVNGCCLTVVAREGETFAMDLSGETLRRTSFGEMKPGTMVNLEPPMRAGDDFGGHFVQGHVDGVGRVVALKPEGENWWLTVRVPEELGKYAAMKGSISLDGISLTIAGWHDGAVDIAIIPYTYEVTNVRNMRLGDAVNVEVDCLAKYIERLLEAREAAAPSRLTVEKLVEQGF
jgi:riboflavin synthase